jgi:hypothetical protein
VRRTWPICVHLEHVYLHFPAALTVVLNCNQLFWSTFWGNPAHFVVNDSLKYAPFCSFWYILHLIWDHRCFLCFPFHSSGIPFFLSVTFDIGVIVHFCSVQILNCTMVRIEDFMNAILIESEQIAQELSSLLRTSSFDTLRSPARPRCQFGLCYKLCS